MADAEPRLVRWTPTPYGIIVAFVLANATMCKTAEERLFAGEAVSKLRLAFRALKPSYDLVANMNFVDPKFDDAQSAFDAQPVEEVVMSGAAWVWMIALMKDGQESGSWATVRARVDETIRNARLE